MNAKMIGTTALTCSILAIVSLAAPVVRAQSSGAVDDKSLLTVIDEAGASHSLTPADFAKLPQHKFKGKTHTGEVEFEGASLLELLKSVGVEFGEKLKGKRAATIALCEAPDGYHIVMSLVEIDPATTDVQAYVVDRADGKPLDAKHGPYQLVIPSDKHEIRWIRNLSSIRILNAATVAAGSIEKHGGKSQP